MPIYEYFNPETDEIIEVLLPIADRNKDYITEDGVHCKRIEVPSDMGYMGRIEGEREVFEVDREAVKNAKPKYIKFRDGHRERYDPSKHC